MFRSNSPYGSETSSYISIQSNGFSTTDETSSQISNISRPSAKSLYLQRLQYAASVNKTMEKTEYKVEHLFTCDLNGKDLKNIKDCVERLKVLDHTSRIWGQDMMLEVRGTNLLLIDFETKEELESFSPSEVKGMEALLDSQVFDSLLIMSIQHRTKNGTTVFLFQCDDVRADYVKKDLTRALSQKNEGSRFSSNGHADGGPERGRQSYKPAEQKPVRDFVPPWTPADNAEDNFPEPELHLRRYREEEDVKPPMPTAPLPPPRPYTELNRNVGELNGKINNPTASDFVHSLFSTLAFVCSRCSEALPQSIIAPLLTPQCIRLLSEEASSEEDELWQSLGDPWNIPSTKWPEEDEDIPTYTLVFFDGWQPPEVTAEPPPSAPESRQESPRPLPSHQPPKSAGQNTQQSNYAKWKRPEERQKPRPVEVKLCDMYVRYDFISRNQRELTVTKGEVVELLDKSKQWWKVRNNRGEEGYIPNNVLEDGDSQSYEEIQASPVLTRKSKPAEVKAWLEQMAFNQITVRCLGVLSGSMLLGMSREELKSVCPEEGGRVYLQLQAVKSA
ncbi:hypothetical protein CRENBAI_025825 [Crenichthys baileyi]|uniref:SH3 domain-containing protein n=1 Tax=Crenichthys baileyi TaxID=28760 RepID=A0AAV9R2D2_9TELE